MNMPTTITLDGARRGGFWSAVKSTLGPRNRGANMGNPLQPWGPRPGQDDRGQYLTGIAGPVGDVWSDDASASDGGTSPVADFTISAVGWGILAFAVGTAAFRGYAAARKLL